MVSLMRSQAPRLGGKSPCGDIEDTDYIDLLLEYKRIQEQLETIKKEEQKTATKSDGHKSGSKNNERGKLSCT